jgi:uncharacterized membrane protein
MIGAMSDNAIEPAGPLFDAVLYPHRSLSPRGFAILMAGVIGAMVLVAAFFTMLGAWPVLPFFGAEILLVFFAFRLNDRDARSFERLRLTQDALTVEQVRPSGRRLRHTFRPPHWLRIDLARRPGGSNELIVSSHGDSLVIGRFLSAGERREIAIDLRNALKRLVSPAAAPDLD